MASSAVRIAHGSLFLVIGNTLRIPIGILTLAFFARSLSLVEMGIVVAFEILLQFLQLISNPGLSRSITTYAAEGLGKGQNVSALVRKLILAGAGLSLCTSLILLLVLGALPSIISGTRVPERILQLLSLDTFFFCVAPYMDSSLLGLRDFKSLSATELTSYAVRQFAGVAFVASGLGVQGVVEGWVLGDGIYLLGAVLAMERNLRRYSSLPRFTVGTRELVTFSASVYGSRLIDFASKWFDRIFVLAVFSIEDLAIYNVAYSIFSFAQSLPDALSGTLLQHYAERSGSGNQSLMNAESAAATRYAALLFTPAFLGLAAVSNPAILLIAGPRYSSAAVLLGVLSGIGALTVSSPGFEQIFYVIKKTNVYVILAIAEALGGLLLSLLLTGPLGMLGIAFARSISLVLVFVIGLTALKELTSIRLQTRSLVKIFLCSATMAMVVYTAEQVYYSLVALPLYIAIGAITYFILVWRMRLLRKRDFDITRELLGARAAPFIDILEKLVTRM
jgi:O-antigen/teichoic acid export membrane protein